MIAAAGWIAWTATWAWLLTFSFSDSYFKYDLCSRGLVFIAAMVGALVLPVGLLRVSRRANSIVGLLVRFGGVVALSLFPLAATSFALSRLPGQCHLSGDDAMGAGIDFILLSGAAMGIGSVATAAGVIRVARRRRTGAK
jgi:hypothetical protein